MVFRLYNTLSCKYDNETDSLYLDKNLPYEYNYSKEIDGSVIIDISVTHQILGLEILHASQVLEIDTEELDTITNLDLTEVINEDIIRIELLGITDHELIRKTFKVINDDDLFIDKKYSYSLKQEDNHEPVLESILVDSLKDPEEGYDNKKQLYQDTQKHRTDVHKMMKNIGEYLTVKGYFHDWSKIEYFNSFAKDTLERKDTPDFKSRPWYYIHTTVERHHVNANVPEDVDLFDILEMITDCTIAGVTRTGEVDEKFLEIPDEVLIESYWNTVRKIKEKILLKDNLEITGL